jgi:hypothetical protein
LTFSNDHGPGGFGGIKRDGEGAREDAGQEVFECWRKDRWRKKEGMNIKD